MMMVSFWLPTTMKITQPEVYASTAWAKMDMTIRSWVKAAGGSRLCEQQLLVFN